MARASLPLTHGAAVLRRRRDGSFARCMFVQVAVPKAVGETVISLTLSLHPMLKHLLNGEGGCSRTPVLPTARC